ncbi:MAG: hypothetical protein A4E66_01846 [Syntrophus sp. PtaB.Bin001]|nr:MAG: hypothetical protein A4E66_01846 [Syntrophus sp. PtaB.Bin001]
MKIARGMGIAYIRRKHVVKAIGPLDAFRKNKVGGFRIVGKIGISPVGVKDELTDVIKRESQAGVHSPGAFQPPFNELRIHQFADQGGRQQADTRTHDLLLHFAADLFGRISVDIRFPNQGIDDPLPVPAGDFLIRRADKEGQVSRILIPRRLCFLHAFSLFFPFQLLSTLARISYRLYIIKDQITIACYLLDYTLPYPILAEIS